MHLVTHHGRVGDTFSESNINYLRGTFGIGHVSLWERQPVKWMSQLGEISVAFSGNIINSKDLIRYIMNKGGSFLQGYDIEIISKIIMYEGDAVAGISALAERIRGAYSLLLLTRDGIFATRDVYGFRPFILGQGTDRFAVSSESRAFHNLDMDIVRDVQPGEIVHINDRGFTTVKQLESPRRAYCSFEWAYTASIDSVIDGLSVQKARNSLGASLAQRDIDEGVLKPISWRRFPCPAVATLSDTICDQN